MTNLFTFIFLLFGLGGWIANIVKIITNYESAGMLVARACGVFMAPLGAVLGYL